MQRAHQTHSSAAFHPAALRPLNPSPLPRPRSTWTGGTRLHATSAPAACLTATASECRKTCIALAPQFPGPFERGRACKGRLQGTGDHGDEVDCQSPLVRQQRAQPHARLSRTEPTSLKHSPCRPPPVDTRPRPSPAPGSRREYAKQQWKVSHGEPQLQSSLPRPVAPSLPALWRKCTSPAYDMPRHICTL